MTDNREAWDVVVIGGGPVGETVAQYAVEGGLSAVVVESNLLGGECSYWACIPSKALLRPVDVRATVGAMEGFSDAVALDPQAVLARRDYWNSSLDDSGQVEWADGAGVDVVRGRGRLDGVRSVAVELPDGATRTIRAERAVVVATGSSAALPPIEGLAEALPWISRDATNVKEIPERVAIIGGGVVAVEAATWLRGLGAREVTLLVRGDRLLERQEPFAGDLVRQAFERRGLDVRFGVQTERVERAGASATGEGRIHGGEVTLTLGDGSSLSADELLVAAGRKPNTVDIGLETVGLEPGRYVEVDDHLTATGVDGDWLYATGDVNGRALLTHQGKYQARVCGDVIAARARGGSLDAPRFRAGADHGAVPQVTFPDPQVGSGGLTEEQARAEHGADAIGAVEYDLGAVAGASLLRNDYEGRAKLVVKRADGTLAGATFVGPDAGELVHGATIAVVGRVDLEALWHAVPSFPTMSEVWLRLLETWRTEN